MLSSEVHLSPSAGMREHLYSVSALSVAIAAGQKKNGYQQNPGDSQESFVLKNPNMKIKKCLN